MRRHDVGADALVRPVERSSAAVLDRSVEGVRAYASRPQTTLEHFVKVAILGLENEQSFPAMHIERWKPAQDGPLSEQTLRRKLEAMGYRITRYIYSPGTYFPMHTHEVDKMDAVVEGHLRITMGEEEVLLGAGDAVYVPQHTEHSAEVVGDVAVVSLDGVKDSR
jgi:mannose-6-phosphate isomerase-like protein (cupin superfamily)